MNTNKFINYDEMVKHRKELPDVVKTQLFAGRVKNLTGDDDYKKLFKEIILLREDGTLTETNLKPLRAKLTDLMNQANTSDKVIDEPDFQTYAFFKANETKTIFEIGQILHKGQIERFVDENINEDSLDYFIDQIKNPKEHTKGFMKKMTISLLVGLMRKANEDVYIGAIIDGGIFRWKDDGATNHDFKMFLTKKYMEQGVEDIEKGNKSNTTSVRM